MAPFDQLERVADFLGKNGLSLAISSAVFLFAVLVGWTYFQRWRRRILPESQADALTLSDLKGHRFFGLIQSYLLTIVPVLPIAEPFRRAVFRDFLRCKLERVRDAMLALVGKVDPDDLTPAEFKGAVLRALSEAIEGYESAALAMGIPPIVIERFRGWHADTISETLAFVSLVCDDDWYPSNRHRMVVILDFLGTALHLTLLHGKKTLKRLNGELDKCPPYHGIVPDPSKHQHTDSLPGVPLASL